MARVHRLAWTLLPVLWAAGLPTAHALQLLDAVDGVTVEAVMSLKEPTRIRVDGASVVSVFGNIHSSNCAAGAAQGASAPAAGGPIAPAAPAAPNPAGEIVVECDSDKGEVYVRPVGGLGKPVNLFVSTRTATYTLLLRRSDTPADTIVIRDKSARQPAADASPRPGERSPQHLRAIKALVVAMASQRVPADVRVEEVNRPVQLWQEASFSLVRMYESRGLVGERYLLTNVSAEVMVLAEPELDRETGGVVAVAIQNHNLRPGESTVVLVVRRGA